MDISTYQKKEIPLHKKTKISFYRKREIPLHLMLLPGVILLFIFSYLPMAGIIIAFQRFIPARGLFGSQQWIGLDNFRFIFSLPTIHYVIRNTLVIAIGKIILGMIVPIFFALLLNEVKNVGFKRCIQTIIYFPHFISWVIFGGILIDILSPSHGMVNVLITALGFEPIFFLGNPRWFQPTMIISDVWKSFGFGTIIYLASVASIDPTLYEASAVDGAGRFRQTLHITLPGMRMIIVLIMVLNLGNVLNAGFDQIFNLLNPAVFTTGDIIDTMVFRMGILDSQFGPATAVGLFRSLVSMVLISTSYYAAYKFFDYRIF